MARTETDFMKDIENEFSKHAEYVIEDFMSEEGWFWTGFKSYGTPIGGNISMCVRFGQGCLLRNDEMISGLQHLMKHIDGIEKHWEFDKLENDSYYVYVSQDIKKPGYFFDHKIHFSDNAEDKEKINEYLKKCEQENIKPNIISPMNNVSLYGCRFTKVGKGTNNECWWDGRIGEYLVGKPDNIDERLYPENDPLDDRKRYTRWS